MNNDPNLDPVGWRLLRALQDDARLSYRELGRRVGLSSPAVAERVRRMEEMGLITGYRATLDPSKVGYPIMVFINLKTTGQHHQRLDNTAQTLNEILECHHVTGQDNFIIKAIVSSLIHLEDLIARLRSYGDTTTSIVLSSPVRDKPIQSVVCKRIKKPPAVGNNN
tara:strand:- start:835 stop:1332 length:498 start_codon:yes stop_codon:yes gene_type:complete